MTRRNCEEYRSQENGKEDRQENEVRRRKKRFQREVVEENAPEENGISNRLFSTTFISPLTFIRPDLMQNVLVAAFFGFLVVAPLIWWAIQRARGTRKTTPTERKD